jgi:hypothetical protein
MQLGREVIGAQRCSGVADAAPAPVPARQPVPGASSSRSGNIQLVELSDASRIELAPRLAVTPFRVPHRDEYSETVGFTIAGPERKVVYIPDIDKWTSGRRGSKRCSNRSTSRISTARSTTQASCRAGTCPRSRIPSSRKRCSGWRRFRRTACQGALHSSQPHEPGAGPGGAARQAIEAAGMHVAAELERSPL